MLCLLVEGECNRKTLRVSAVFAVVPCPLSVCLSIRLGESYCQTSFRPDCLIICIFDLSASTQFQGKPFLWGGGKCTGAMGFLTKIAACRCCGLTPVNDR